MKRWAKRANALKVWSSIPGRIRKAVSGLSARELSLRGGSEGWSIREYVHHLVEANLVASNIVLAGLGKPGCRYDWSWVTPDARWMKRLGYDRAPIEAALERLEQLGSHVSRVVGGGLRAYEEGQVTMTLVPHDKGAEATVSRVTRPAHGSNPRRAARELRAALLVENRHGR